MDILHQTRKVVLGWEKIDKCEMNTVIPVTQLRLLNAVALCVLH
jgi:hypothetical protein